MQIHSPSSARANGTRLPRTYFSEVSVPLVASSSEALTRACSTPTTTTGPPFGGAKDLASVGEPGCRDLDPGAEVQDLTVFESLYVDQPDLLSGRMRLVAR